MNIYGFIMGGFMFFLGMSGGLPPKTTDTATVGTVLFIVGISLIISSLK